MLWRWDQGRTIYFSFDEIKRIASALVAFEGKQLSQGGSTDTLRAILQSYSNMPFSPNSKDYPVWRNYGRVFGCQMLATQIDRIVICTDICRAIADDTVISDEYLTHVARNFYYSSPVFEGYHATGAQVFPICAILKLLVSDFITKAKPNLSITEIAARIKGNSVDGTEPLAFFKTLKATGTTFGGDELRQVREMIVFISQFSFLKWLNSNLILDVGSIKEAELIANLAQPVKKKRDINPARELLHLGSGAAFGIPTAAMVASQLVNPLDVEFTEGSKVRQTHLRTERSSKLKEFYFENAPHPHVCNVCAMNTKKHYPWALRLVELHHLLPLSSPILVEKKSTSLKDVVGLCPSCHRATHKYYSIWLRKKGLKDFRGHDEAKKVYHLAKNAHVA